MKAVSKEYIIKKAQTINVWRARMDMNYYTYSPTNRNTRVVTQKKVTCFLYGNT